MSGRNRHQKYRRGVYKRRSIGTVIITSAVSLAVFLLILIIIGNSLHKKSIAAHSADTSADSDITDTQPQDPIKKRNAKSINGQVCLLRTSDATVFSQRLDALVSAGGTSASIPLNKNDGTLLYSSSIASKLGYTVTADAASLTDASTAAKERGVYLSGIYQFDAFSVEDKLLRSVELSTEAAMIAEILNSGVDEVVLVISSLDPSHKDELIRFIDDIRSLTESGSVGITVPSSILENENVSQIISDLDKGIDFLAMDLSEHGDISPAKYVDERINSDSLIYLHMYKMRLLLPYSADEAVAAEIVTAAQSNGISNWQIFAKVQ